MTDRGSALPSAADPSPRAGRVSLASLMFGFAGAPLAWTGQTILNYAFSSHNCYPGSLPRTTVLEGHEWTLPVSIAINIAAIILSIAAGWVAFQSWHATRSEAEGGHDQLVQLGQGRSRFLAYSGLVTSAGFLLAIIAASLSFWVPLCGH